MIYTVTDSAGLYDALAQAQGGDTIKLAAGGDYDLSLLKGAGTAQVFDSPVTITSADPQAPATFSEMHLDGVTNLVFDNVVFDYTYDSADALWFSPFTVYNSDNITVKNSLFDGDLPTGRSAEDDGYGFGKGLVVSGSSDIAVENNEFQNWHRGLVVDHTQDIRVVGNDVHSIRSDGINFAAVESVLIEDNYIHDFHGSLESDDHRDMIQFWTNGTETPSTDIVIRNNTLDIGDGDWTQSIFMRNDVVDRGLAGQEMFYQNILIEENVILNGHSHGITVGETDGLIIRNNTLLSIATSDEQFFQAPAINLSASSVDVFVENNAVSVINGAEGNTGIIITNNVYIQNEDPGSEGYYGDMFLESSQYGSGGVAGYVVTPGSALDTLAVGAPQLVLDTTPDTLTPQFDVHSSGQTSQSLIFDASYTYGPAGQASSENSTFVWDFGDGTTMTGGAVVNHTYADAGEYEVTLTVTQDGTTATASTSAEIGVAGEDVLAFNAATGLFYSQGYGYETSVAESDAGSVSTGTGKAVDLGGTGTTVEIAKESIARFFGSNDFEMSMTLQADQPDISWGEVARIHGSMVVGVQGDGNLQASFFLTSGEQVDLVTSGVSINDGAAHDISIQLDGASGTLHLVVDGKLEASQAVTGSMPLMEHWGLVFGEPWGGQNFDGKLSAFNLDASSVEYQAFEGSVDSGDPAPGPEDDAALPVIDDYIIEFAELPSKKLQGEATVDIVDDSEVLELAGGDDHIDLRRLKDFEDSEQLSFSVDFRKTNADAEDMRLVWNHKKVGLVVEEDGLRVHIAEDGSSFQHESILIDNLGLDDTESHQAIVIMDAETDRLQVVLDGEVVLDRNQQSDIDFVGAGGDEWGWTIGSEWSHDFEGEVTDFRIEADAQFVAENSAAADDMSLLS